MKGFLLFLEHCFTVVYSTVQSFVLTFTGKKEFGGFRIGDNRRFPVRNQAGNVLQQTHFRVKGHDRIAHQQVLILTGPSAHGPSGQREALEMASIDLLGLKISSF